MSIALQPGQIDDLVEFTLPNLNRFKFTDIAYDLQEHTAASRLIKKNRVSFSDGESINMNLRTEQGDQFRWTALYDTDDIQVQNMMTKANVPWCMGDTHFGYDVRESAFNGGKSAIINLLTTRRHDAMVSMTAGLESAFWSLPDTGLDNKKPYGLPYWLTPGPSKGFQAPNPAGFSNVAGIDRTNYPNWRNWTDVYTAVSKADLIRKVREGATKTKFKPPVSYNSMAKASDKYTHCVPYSVLGILEELLDSSNDNLGRDFGKYDGTVMFRRVPVEWVPYLDADASEPWLGINWSVFSPVFMRGQWMRYSRPQPGSSHNTRVVFIDIMMNYMCCDPRRMFRVNK